MSILNRRIFWEPRWQPGKRRRFNCHLRYTEGQIDFHENWFLGRTVKAIVRSSSYRFSTTRNWHALCIVHSYTVYMRHFLTVYSIVRHFYCHIYLIGDQYLRSMSWTISRQWRLYVNAEGKINFNLSPNWC